jgi:reversibly glycosylated polypeptide/UDP-arabinopyranose mutase
MKALVVPTIRSNCLLNFLKAWNDVKDWDVTIIVEDNPTKTFQADVDFHFAWDDIDKDLGESSWIISRRDSAIRSYGFYKAYQLGADYIFSLDDDCYPIEGVRFCEEHINNLENFPKWCGSVLGKRTRGLPYKNLGKLDNVKFSVGLWKGVSDHDAVAVLSGNDQELPIGYSRIIPKDQYFPFCGMNFAFKREATPLTYFALMGEGYPFGRFDDIWFGIICKKICDHLGYLIACGHPCVRHSKASNVFNNLVKEAPGIKYNENFWELIDQIKLEHTSPIICMREIALALKYREDDEYLNKLGTAIQSWVSLFTNLK